MINNKLIISISTVLLSYVLLYRMTCKEKESYYDQTSLMYAALMGGAVFLGMRTMESNCAALVDGKPMVNENVMTTPFGK